MNYNLCCGKELLIGWNNVDELDFGQEIIANIEQDWSFMENESVEKIRIKDGFEHLNNPNYFLEQCEKKLVEGGIVTIFVPHYKAPSAYKLTHKTYYSWSTFGEYPEPHDKTKILEVVENKLILSNGLNALNPIINLLPKWYEKIGYVESIKIVLRKKG